MHNSRILEYFRMYAQHFDLTRRVRFQTAVRSVKKRPDFSLSGQWEVVSVSSAGQEQSETFDGVMVCTGHHTHPHMPLHDFPELQKLPPEKTMLKDIENKKKAMAKRYVLSQRHTIQVDYIPYMDELAAQLGVRPRLGWLLFRDPRLGLQLLLGPCTPYQYRLCGPGQWAGARRAILTQWDRVAKPLRTRVLPETPRPSTVPLLLKLCFGV
ncbi:UNVERIFIED_CONTAM: hypothetical protein FKN15_010222 [Acipenser sinensis]